MGHNCWTCFRCNYKTRANSRACAWCGSSDYQTPAVLLCDAEQADLAGAPLADLAHRADVVAIIARVRPGRVSEAAAALGRAAARPTPPILIASHASHYLAARADSVLPMLPPDCQTAVLLDLGDASFWTPVAAVFAAEGMTLFSLSRRSNRCPEIELLADRHISLPRR